MALPIFLFLLGSTILYLGAEGLVRGAIRIAGSLGVSPMAIGVTVVAFGTSMPEFVVSLISAISGSSDLALGNVVGSNIANIGLILAIGAIARPVDVDKLSLRLYYPVLIISALILYIISTGSVIGCAHGFFLVAGMVLFTVHLLRRTPPQMAELTSDGTQPPFKLMFVVMTIVGVVFLLIGSHLMITSGISIARMVGVSEFVIGVSMVAVGTSLPELATTVVSFVKRNTDIILGNVLGSNIFNVLFVIGGVSLIHPIQVNATSRMYEFPAMIIFSLVLFLMMRTNYTISRTEGFVLLLGYIIFVRFLF